MLIVNKYVYNLLWNAFYCQRVIVDTIIHLKLKSPVGDFNFYEVIFEQNIFILLGWLWEQSYSNVDRPKSNIFLQSDSSSQH